MKYTGGCFCGNLRFEFTGEELPVADCHCTMCRRTSGAPYVTWLVIPINDFQYTKGEPTELASSEDGTRYFCNQCGTPVACINKTHPEIIDITLGSLDQPEAFTPAFNVFDDTRLPSVITRLTLDATEN